MRDQTDHTHMSVKRIWQWILSGRPMKDIEISLGYAALKTISI